MFSFFPFVRFIKQNFEFNRIFYDIIQIANTCTKTSVFIGDFKMVFSHSYEV